MDDLKMIHEEEMKDYDRIENAVVSVMRRHGCKIVQTPTFADYDTYSKIFPRLKKEMIKTIAPSGEVLVLRPDMTVSLLQTISKEYPDPRQLLKLGYVSVVFRNYYGRSTHGNYFLQSGVEVLGDETAECDGEIITMAAEFLESLGIRDRRIDIGTVAYMDALFEEMALSEKELSRLREYLEKRDLVSFEALADSLKITKIQRDVLLTLPSLFGDYEETLKRAEGLCLNRKMKKSLERLREIYDYLRMAGFADEIQLDFGFTSHMGYYTDMVFKVYAEGALYSLINGGRYDSLASEFFVPRPACGFGMNMNLLYELMSEKELTGKMGPGCDLAVVYEKSDRELVRTLVRWREKGFSVMGISGGNTISEEDYKRIAYYKSNGFLMEEKLLTAEEVEALLGGGTDDSCGIG